jgi:2',3'-cyclic-nucleotide 2'-phosphodiesterase (5'-nucleotidase family)
MKTQGLKIGAVPRTHYLLNLAVTSLVLFNPFRSSACDDQHLHQRSQQSATQPLTPPTRDLEWGDLNIIHTTDTHVCLGIQWSMPYLLG